MGYEPTANEDVIIQTNDKNVDISTLIATYQSLKSQYLNLPNVKTVADQETLDFWNENISNLRAVDEATIRVEAEELYNIVKAVKDAGLLPSKYDGEFNQLEAFVTG